MKHTLQILVLFLGLFCLGLASPGCATKSPQTISGQTLMSTAQTVDAAMSSFATWVKLHEGTASPVTQTTIDHVSVLHANYVSGMEVARAAWVAAAQANARNSTALATAISVVAGSSAELISFIQTITK